MKVTTNETVFKFIIHRHPLRLEELLFCITGNRTKRLNVFLRVTKSVEVEESGFDVRFL